MPAVTQATAYGYTSRIRAPFTRAEAAVWFEEVRRAVGTRHDFGQLIDARLQPAATTPETNAVIEDAMTWVVAQGLRRSAVVVSSTIVKTQIQRMARNTGVYAHERYFDASADPGYEAKAVAWITQGTEPDQ